MKNNVKFNAENKMGVYFILSKDNGCIKIGCSNNVAKRFNEIKRSFSFLNIEPNIEFLGYIEVYKMYDLEKLFHKEFEDSRRNGEWFDVSFRDILQVANDIELNKYDKDEDKFSPKSESEYIMVNGEKYFSNKGLNYINSEISKFNIKPIAFERYYKYFENMSERYRYHLLKVNNKTYVTDVLITSIFVACYKHILNEDYLLKVTDKIFEAADKM